MAASIAAISGPAPSSFPLEARINTALCEQIVANGHCSRKESKFEKKTLLNTYSGIIFNSLIGFSRSIEA